jgi:hypothetical protein
MGVLEQFNLIMKYKKGNTNKLVDMLSRTPSTKVTTFGILMHMEPFAHDAYERNTQKMRTPLRYFSNYKVKFV